MSIFLGHDTVLHRTVGKERSDKMVAINVRGDGGGISAPLVLIQTIQLR
jgi:hypothetical protein